MEELRKMVAKLAEKELVQAITNNLVIADDKICSLVIGNGKVLVVEGIYNKYFIMMVSSAVVTRVLEFNDKKISDMKEAIVTHYQMTLKDSERSELLDDILERIPMSFDCLYKSIESVDISDDKCKVVFSTPLETKDTIVMIPDIILDMWKTMYDISSILNISKN